MPFNLLSEIQNTNSGYKGVTLTEEQKKKALEDIGLDDPAINLLAIYALVKKKNTALSDSLFKTWVEGLKDNLNLLSEDIVVDSTAKSGILFDEKQNKPKTLRVLINDILSRVSKAEENLSDKENINLIKSRIGAELFVDSNLITSSETINDRLKRLEMSIKQLSSDIFNTDGKIGDEQNQAIYRMTTDRQTQNLTIMDLINRLYNIHGGGRLPSHSNIQEEVYLNITTSKVEILPGESVFLFLNNNEKYTSHNSQNTRWSYRVNGTISNMLAYVSKNTLNGTSYISVYVNGIEQPKKVSIGPNALGSFDMAEMGISVQFLDSIAIKVTAESANSGTMVIDNTGLTVLKGPN